jgi:hypothetical protein
VECRRQTTASSAWGDAARWSVPTGDWIEVVKTDESILFLGCTGEPEQGREYKERRRRG